MNKVILMGRLTANPEIREAQDTKVARYTLAVDRRFKKDGEKNADFLRCVAFGNDAVFAEKYLGQGKKIVVTGRLKTGSYKNRDGATVYTTDVVIESQEFAESKGFEEKKKETVEESEDEFISVPEGLEEELPFI